MSKTYQDLIILSTFEDRFDFLKIGGPVGRATFGFERYLNQALYQSKRWKRIRDEILIRDEGCDLGIKDREIFSRPTIHHITPITIEDVEEERDIIFDLNNLITTSNETHNAIHYGKSSMIRSLPKERQKGDMCPWLAMTN